MDANELRRWTRFAAKGGIGKGTAVHDCIAEQLGDLMFLEGDEITVLMQLPGKDDLYLGYCEDVVGRFHGHDVKFHAKLKKPVFTKRSSTATLSSRPSSSLSAITQGGRDSVPLSFPPASPSLPPPSRTSHRRTPSNLSTDSPASIPASLPPQSLPLLPPPQLVPYHLRSVSHSSESTAIESAPRTPADFTKDGFQDSLVVSRQVDSPLEYDLDSSLAAADVSLPPDTDPLSSSHPSLSSDPDPESEDTSTVEDHSAQSRLPELSSAFLDSESSARLSRISGLSDGEVGIGLSLLQDFINGVDDSDSRPSSRSSYNSVVAPTLDNESTPVELSSHPVVSPTSPSSQQRPPSQSPVPPFVREVTSRSSTHPSVTDSEYGTEEWEGASDIYDNYRYSRLSMASKMSRLSRGSMHTVASAFGLEVPPPVPRDTARSSLDSQDPGRSRMGSLAESSHTHDSSPEHPIKVTPERKRSDEGKHVPSPLIFASEITSSRPTVNDTSATSPLLHATFASPLASPSAHSTNAFLSPSSASPTFPSAIGGVASALRQRIEMERTVSPGGSQRATSPSALSDVHPPSVNRLSTEPIVQDDEDELRIASPSTSSSPSSRAPSRESISRPNDLEVSSSSPEASTTAPSSTESTFVSEKQALQSSFVVVNPPPPYTPLAVEPETSNVPHASGSVASSPSPTQRPPPPQSTIRPLNINRAPSSPSARTSLFMPHPHAPKPTLSPTGPMYGRTPPPVSPLSPPLSGPVPGSLMHTLGLLYSHRFDRGHIRRTLYALFETDLSHSIGPVPVTFSLEPPQSVPANHRHPPSNRPPRQPSPLAPPPVQQQSAANMAPATSSPSAPSPDPTIPGVNDNQDATSKAIPRANFFPKVQTPRPRSRSFSGYDATTVELELPKKQSPGESANPPVIVPPQGLGKRSKSASAMLAQPPSKPPAASPSPRGSPLANNSTRVTSHKPSPLSLSHNNVVADQPPTSPSSPARPPPSPSPLSRPPIVGPSPLSQHLKEVRSSSPMQVPGSIVHKPSLGQVISGAQEAPSSPRALNAPVVPPSGSSQPSPPLSGPTSPTSPTRPVPRSPPVIRQSRSSLSGRRLSGRETSPSRSSIQGRLSGDTDSDGRPSVFGGSPPGSGPLGRNGSLRSKLSLPTLRIRNSERSSSMDIHSPTLSLSPSEGDLRTVQIKDTDFELVQPVAAQVLNSPKDDLFSIPPSPTINRDSFARSGSPAQSSITAPAPRPRVAPLSLTPAPAKPIDTDVEAHRQRELRWISTMASVPPSQSRKSKKIRRLLQEGVPASVRYLVWAHLTDSKSKRMDGLYARLGKRERVAAAPSIERDVQRCFVNHPELQDGSLANLLQAYLTMVPDIQYSRGLTAIAGCLLMQSPEEDAFWTFISLMDTHLRSYFSSTAIQLEVDGSLFGKALESNEPALAKKVFVDMALSPVTICRPWFSSLFVDVLPTEYLHRVWDIFLFEGVSFLFRVGLAIFLSCKQLILASVGRDAVFNILMHPPSTILPGTPDALLDIAFSAKLRDGDLQKQRQKMEAQIKRTTQSSRNLIPQGVGINVSTPAISLPKA